MHRLTDRIQKSDRLLLVRVICTSLLQMIGTTKGGFQWQNWDFKTGYKTTQWRSTVSAPSCAFCNKAVFPAEEVVGAGQKFHKFCLKCRKMILVSLFKIPLPFFRLDLCYTLLNSGNLNEHEKKIYCATCYRRQFGPQGRKSFLLHKKLKFMDLCLVVYDSGTALSTSTRTPPNSPNLNQRKINLANHCYQRKTSIGSLISYLSFDDDSRYNNSQINKMICIDMMAAQQIKYRSSLSTNLTSSKMQSVSENICPRCLKTVYLAEGVKAAGKVK